jgi:type II secretory pathway pseudopilin PulG
MNNRGERLFLKKKGITLVENLIALFLIAIVVASTLFALVSAQRYIAIARHHYRAVSFAREAAERVIAGLDPQAGQRVLDPATGMTGNLIDNSVGVVVEIIVAWNESIVAGAPQARAETIIYVR